MDNLIFKLKSKLKIKVEGKNLERFIKRLNRNHIELLNIKYLKYDTIIITIYEADFKKVEEIKTIYNISIVGTSGIIKIKKNIKKNNILILSIFIGIIILYILSNYMHSVEIIHSSSNVRNLLKSELTNYGIKEKSFKKSFNEIKKIKEKILQKHKKDIEWLEIEVVGTKYVVRVEERKIKNIKQKQSKKNIVAKKSAIIKDVIAKDGEIVKFKNDYVKTGETVISGEIKLNDEVKNITSADGLVFGEVWYKVHVEYPYTYYEEYKTGKEKNVLVFNFLNKHYELSLNHFKNKITTSKTIFSNLLPISLTLDHEQELKVTSSINTSAEAVIKAQNLAREKIQSQLNDKEYIIDQKNLKVISNESTIEVEEFFTVYENITAYEDIIENNVLEEE